MTSTWSQDMAYAAFDECGNMIRNMPIALTSEEIALVYVRGIYVSPKDKTVTFKPMSDVPLTLALDHFDQKTKTFWWRHETKETFYPMFPTEFNDMLAKGIDTNLVDGMWTIAKRGTGFGLKFIEYA